MELSEATDRPRVMGIDWIYEVGRHARAEMTGCVLVTKTGHSMPWAKRRLTTRRVDALILSLGPRNTESMDPFRGWQDRRQFFTPTLGNIAKGLLSVVFQGSKERDRWGRPPFC